MRVTIFITNFVNYKMKITSRLEFMEDFNDFIILTKNIYKFYSTYLILYMNNKIIEYLPFIIEYS